MKEKIRYYPQHPLDPNNPTMETCGAACVLMLMDYYDMIRYPTQKIEVKIYSHYRVNGYKGITGAAIARYLSMPKEHQDMARFLTGQKKKLNVHLVQSYHDKMDNRDGYFPEDIYETVMASHEMHLEKCKERIRFSNGMDFDTAFLKQELETGKKIILECFIPENPDEPPSLLHWVILERYDEQSGLFRVRDPNRKVKLLHLTEAEVEAYMDTPIGRICIVVEEETEKQESF